MTTGHFINGKKDIYIGFILNSGIQPNIPQVSLTGFGKPFPCLAASAPGAPSPAGLHISGIGVEGSILGFKTRPIC
jgi:hypothetical protein